MSKNKQLVATRRASAGKGAARAVRRDGLVPAVIYGAGQPPVAISVDAITANKVIYAGHFLTTVFDIDVEGETIRTLPRDYQLDPVYDRPVHIDFMRIGAGSRVRVEVPVHVINQDIAPGIKRGGVLNIVLHSIGMLVPAEAIPDGVTIDLAGMDINASVHLSDIKMPEGCRATSQEKDATILTIAAPSGGKDEAAAPAAAAAAPAKGAAKPAAAKPAAKK